MASEVIMSTRANIIIKDEYSKLIFYRHSDGYPECAGEDLKQFVDGYTKDLMRTNAMQSAGWLILRGNKEYEAGSEPTKEGFSGWKVGAYEPTNAIHGDIEYLYTIDLAKRVLTCKNVYSKKIEFKKVF